MTNQNQSQSNAYFEQQLKKFVSGLSDEELTERIHQCQTVLGELANSPAWKITIADSRKWIKQLDDVWQDVFDEKQLNAMRVLKAAYKHILELPQKYLSDLEFVKSEWEVRNHPEDNTEKDYDNETTIEE
jgi:hypothetical protein